MPLFRLPPLEIQVTEINIWFLMGCFATLLGEWKNIAKGTTGQNWVFVSKRRHRNNDKTALNIQANFMVWPNHSILCHITDNQMSSCSWAIRNAFLNTNINISNKIWASSTARVTLISLNNISESVNSSVDTWWDSGLIKRTENAYRHPMTSSLSLLPEEYIS